MKGQTNHFIIDNALPRTLRTHMTDAEQRLWRALRGRQLAGCKFRRQHPFMDYVLDFVCLEKRLVVEVDGGQHQDSEGDMVRDARLKEAGFRVLRFWNNQVLQETEAVVEVIYGVLTHPPPGLPLEGGGVKTFPPLEGRGECTFPPLQGEGQGGDGETHPTPTKFHGPNQPKLCVE